MEVTLQLKHHTHHTATSIDGVVAVGGAKKVIKKSIFPIAQSSDTSNIGFVSLQNANHQCIPAECESVLLGEKFVPQF